ncbi:hypothetical protein [Sphingomonas phyllosphaerae]|uniref:hypothetical protein n=1 Tax=Sphingomonas phyllosphaerae TaxID=257003 RepID=UPI0024137309|nr:hypothetical protein [Sphingomonas phyllosphaerae]
MRGERSDGAGTRARAPAARATGSATTVPASGGAARATAYDTTERATTAPAIGGAEGVTARDRAEGVATSPATRSADRVTARATAADPADVSTTRSADRARDGSAVQPTAASAPTAPGGAARVTPLDAATRACFLDQLAMLGCPARAAAAVGIALVSAYALRRRSARFAAAWRDALAIGYERLEAEALRHVLERETPLDLAAALALLDRHRAAAASAPVAPPRTPRGQRGALGPVGAELARRLQLYAGATPGVRRTPVSPAAAAAVDALERDVAADWGEADRGEVDRGEVDRGEVDESVSSRAGAEAGAGADAADTGAGSSAATSVAPDAPVDPAARERPPSGEGCGDCHDGRSHAGSRAAVLTSATAIGSVVDAPDAACAAAALPSAAGAGAFTAACHAASDVRSSPFAPLIDSCRRFCPIDAPPDRAGGAPPPGVTPASRPRVWA